MKKKIIAMILTCTMAVSLAACGNSSTTGGTSGTKTENPGSADGTEKTESVELEVVTTFAGNDGNAQTYKKYYQQWEKNTGNKVIDMSATADDTFKARVVTDFETGSEPDVLFFL